MCNNGKCLHFLEMETGSLIFAILNIMITACGSVTSLGSLVYVILITEAELHKLDKDGRQITSSIVLGLTANAAFIILSVSFCLSFSFAVVLLVGLCKRKAGLVKCYFVFGVMVLVFVASVLLGTNMNSQIALLIVGVLAIYGFILKMIRLTYKKFEAEVAFNSFSNPVSTIEKF